MWQLTALANGAILLAYSLIGATILRALVRERQVRSNPLGTATAAIFLTCAVHHGAHTAHLLLPVLGVQVDSGLAMRRSMGASALAWDALSAGIAVYYWSLRRSYGPLVRGGPTLFADLKARQRGALEINDTIVQGLTLAQYRYESGDPERAHAAVVATLAGRAPHDERPRRPHSHAGPDDRAGRPRASHPGASLVLGREDPGGRLTCRRSGSCSSTTPRRCGCSSACR